MHQRIPALILLLLTVFCALAGKPSQGSLPIWDDYQVIMWVGDSAFRSPEKLPVFFERLREMGVTAGMVHREASPEPFLKERFPYYVENMVNRGLCLKWNSNVTNWEKFVTDWAKAGRPDAKLVRDYCFDDPAWMNGAVRQMQKLAARHAEHRPLAYNIRDELSVTVSANPFDYDFNPLALEAFRVWLRSQYSDLNALNEQWETEFADWKEVMPFTTDQIKGRMSSGKAVPEGVPDWKVLAGLKFDLLKAREEFTQWNFSPWADFRTYMDLSLARTLAGLREASRKVDPRTPVGIEGTQMPHAFGGYDLWRLSQVVDWIEPYDIASAREIFGSFMPGKVFVTTVFEDDTRKARRRLWHLLLEGDRGCIIWWSEDCFQWENPKYDLTAKARALQPVLKELRGPVARLFMNAERVRDPIFIHYSQASIQVNWLLESAVDGSTWLRRFSSYEAAHNEQARVRTAWLKAFQDLGWAPRFVSSEQIESGILRTNPAAALILPRSWAMSEKEQEEVQKALQETNGLKRLFVEGPPGVFDLHGRLGSGSRFERTMSDLPTGLNKCVAVAGGKAASFDLDLGALRKQRSAGKGNDLANWIAEQMGEVKQEVSVPASACVRVHRYRLNNNRLLAFERNIDYQMDESLAQRGGNEALEKATIIVAGLDKKHHVYDIQTGRYFGHLDEITFLLDPWKPALFALTPQRLSDGDIVAQLGNTGSQEN